MCWGDGRVFFDFVHIVFTRKKIIVSFFLSRPKTSPIRPMDFKREEPSSFDTSSSSTLASQPLLYDGPQPQNQNANAAGDGTINIKIGEPYVHVSARQQQQQSQPRLKPKVALTCGNVVLTKPVIGIDRIGNEILRSTAIRAAIAIYESDRTNDRMVAEIIVYDGTGIMRVSGIERLFIQAIDPSCWNLSTAESTRVNKASFDAQSRHLVVEFVGAVDEVAISQTTLPEQTTTPIIPACAPIPDRVIYSSRAPEASVERIVDPTHSTIVGTSKTQTYDKLAIRLAKVLSHSATESAIWSEAPELRVEVFEPSAHDQGCYVVSTKGIRQFEKFTLLPSSWDACGIPQDILQKMAARFDVSTGDHRIRMGMSVVRSLYEHEQYLKRPQSDKELDASSRKRRRSQVFDSLMRQEEEEEEDEERASTAETDDVNVNRTDDDDSPACPNPKRRRR